MKKVVISGFGDIGQRVAKYWLKEAHVTGIRRQPLSFPGAKVVSMDLDQSIVKLPDADILYHFTPPPNSGDTDPRFRHLLQAIQVPPEKVILLSTSAVYGNCKGAWVTEENEVQPLSDRGKRRADAERMLQEWCEQRDCAWVILRVPGIYGPNRLPLERLKQLTPAVNESEAPFTNRIHSEDLANIAYIAAKQEKMQGIYNACDGQPGNMTDYFNRVADMFDLPRPPQISLQEAQQQLSPGMLSYLRESRRMSNEKLLHDSGYRFQYPDLDSGLRAIREEME